MARPLKDPKKKVEYEVNRALGVITKLQGLADRGYVHPDHCDKIHDAISKELKRMNKLAEGFISRQGKEERFKL